MGADTENGQEREIDRLKYRGNDVPRFLRLVWTALIAFSFYYLARFMWPDLMEWLKK